jgi:hypothetical protein
MADHITVDPIYETVAPDNFRAMIEAERYGRRSDAFDGIISATHDHFWDPMDKAYIDYDDKSFDPKTQLIMPREQVLELTSAVADQLDEGQQIALGNQIMRWNLSNILHGEQGAMSLSASLCHLLTDPGAQEYASNQAREEARHVTGFGRYIEKRWGKPFPVGQTLGSLLDELVGAQEVYKKLVGMQLLVEGLAMGAFASIHSHTNDPVLKRLTQLVMTDEAFHHKFGKIWAERTIPKLSEEEHNRVEDWAARCFETILFNLINVEQKKDIYGQFGLEWEWVRDACQEVFTDEDRREALKEQTNIFRVLVKTLVKADIVTDRTRNIYATWVSVDELEGESDEMVGDAIAAEGIDYLREINKSRRVIGQKPTLVA